MSNYYWESKAVILVAILSTKPFIFIKVGVGSRVSGRTGRHEQGWVAQLVTDEENT
jgi:hypothetical protein